MKKVKYYFNPNTLRFEKIDNNLQKKLLRFFGYFITSLCIAILILLILFTYVDSPKVRFLKHQNEVYSKNYTLLKARLNQIQIQMEDLEDRDNYVYKSIFEAFPVPDSARAQEIERENKIQILDKMTDLEIANSIIKQLNNLTLRIAYQKRSFEELEDLVKNKEKLLKATPGIQPISNKQLTRLSSGFSYRIDPFLKVIKFHHGVDFTAPTGTPIYATADGVVVAAGSNPDHSDGYGIKVVINHGFGFTTLYGHMVKVKAHIGQHVTRGEVIGYVGSTGRSTGPHLHYEVVKNKILQNPAFYFYKDLTPAEFDRVIKIANTNKQSFD